MTTKLGLYNGALRALGEAPLLALTDNRASRRTLDSVWDDGFVDSVLEAGQWNFATRIQKLTPDTAITPAFGYRNAFVKPDDFVRLTGISADEFIGYPLMEYSYETGYWFSDVEELYIRFVSNHVDYGGDLSAWTRAFVEYAKHALAAEAAPMVNDSKLKDVVQLRDRFLADAKSRDGMEQPTQSPPPGSWLQARTRSGFNTNRIIFER